MSSRRAAILVLLVLLAASLGLGVPPPALGFSGGIHDTATQRAAELEKTYSFFEAITGTDPYGPQRLAAKAHIFPELSNNGSLLASVLSGAALGYDGLVGDMGTRNHFWTCDEGLHECPEGIVGLDNAWEVAYEEWMNAVVLHRAGMPYQAMEHLGRVLHLVQDMAQPAHTNSDLHGPTNRDSLEEWGGYDIIRPMYSWTDQKIPSPGTFLLAAGRQAVINRVLNHPGWAGHDEFLEDPLLSNPNDPYNVARLFSIMYVTNQWANYFPSDGEDGNASSDLGWIDYQALGFPTHLHRYGVNVSPHSERALDDNEGDCGHPGATDEYCDYDGDLTTIATWCYRIAMKATGGVIELFRQTVDPYPPKTKVTLTRDDGKPVEYTTWGNSPVTMVLSDAVDTYAPTTGIWTVYATVDGQPWFPRPIFPVTTLRHYFAETGRRVVQVCTTDNAGNVEQTEVLIKVDRVPPAVDFSSMHDWYFTCEQVKAMWTVTDADSRVQDRSGEFDFEPVYWKSVIDPARLWPGQHVLSVTARDWAGNVTQASFPIYVWLETGTVVGKPTATRIGTTRTYTFTGTLAPVHHVDSAPITLTIAKKKDRSWVIWRKIPAKIAADGTYRGVMRMETGYWRVRATHFLPWRVSPWRYFTVE